MKSDLLEKGVHVALETYSNVHRGSGHYSMVSTHLYEKAREIVLEYLELKKSIYTVIFCSPRSAEALMMTLPSQSYKCLSSQEIGLALGVRALAVKRKVLPKGPPKQTGGGTASLISPDWVVWGGVPERFEAGTPAIINVIEFAIALRIVKKHGGSIFDDSTFEKLSAHEILFDDEMLKFSGRDLLERLRLTLIGRNSSVPTVYGGKSYVNLDYSASNPTFEPVWTAFRKTLQQPQAVQKEIVGEVRSICAEILNAPMDSYDIFFTSNTTESVNIAAESLYNEPGEDIEPVLVTTILEHSSNDLPWRMLSGYSLIRLSVDKNGFIDLNSLDELLSAYNKKFQFGNRRIKVVALSGASNVLGTCNDLEELGRIVHRYGARLFVDAAQLVAHRKVDMTDCRIDYLAFSAHKVYAPFGCGVLIVKKGSLSFNNGEIEKIISSGEENGAGIVALGAALLLLQRIGIDLIHAEEQALLRRALTEMEKIPGLRIFGIKNPDSPEFKFKGPIILFSLKGIQPNIVARELAERGGIGVRYGCHCAHILIKHLLGVPPALARFQRILITLFPDVRLPGLVRVSLGLGSSIEDIDTFIGVLNEITKKSDNNKTAASAGKHILSKQDIKKQIKDFVRASENRVYSCE